MSSEIIMSYNTVHEQKVYGKDFTFTGAIKSMSHNRDIKLVYLEVEVCRKRCFALNDIYYKDWFDTRFFNVKTIEVSQQ